jgi:hypothetical protein
MVAGVLANIEQIVIEGLAHATLHLPVRDGVSPQAVRLRGTSRLCEVSSLTRPDDTLAPPGSARWDPEQGVEARASTRFFAIRAARRSRNPSCEMCAGAWPSPRRPNGPSPSQDRRYLHLLGWRDSTNRAACRWRRGGGPGGQRDETWSKGTNYRMHPVNVRSRTTPCGHSSRDALSLPPGAGPLEVDIPSRRVLTLRSAARHEVY